MQEQLPRVLKQYVELATRIETRRLRIHEMESITIQLTDKVTPIAARQGSPGDGIRRLGPYRFSWS